jgi:hypothetical protein
MTRLQAHGMFGLMTDREFFPDLATDPHFPAVATALAELSGLLGDAKSDDDLREAAAHGVSLYESGVLEGDEIADTASEVIHDVMRWCESQGATCSQDS